MNVNRLCGSGLQAIVSASQAILLGDCDVAIGGGAENMSRAPTPAWPRALARAWATPR
jgi:acetyl-CoA C-acetyltransferase